VVVRARGGAARCCTSSSLSMALREGGFGAAITTELRWGGRPREAGGAGEEERSLTAGVEERPPAAGRSRRRPWERMRLGYGGEDPP
jgi:hypothetical protein